jgi:hypothetical protein
MAILVALAVVVTGATLWAQHALAQLRQQQLGNVQQSMAQCQATRAELTKQVAAIGPVDLNPGALTFGGLKRVLGSDPEVRADPSYLDGWTVTWLKGHVGAEFISKGSLSERAKPVQVWIQDGRVSSCRFKGSIGGVHIGDSEAAAIQAFGAVTQRDRRSATARWTVHPPGPSWEAEWGTTGERADYLRVRYTGPTLDLTAP